MAKDLAHSQGQSGQDWLTLVTELNDLEQQRLAEKKRAARQTKTRSASLPTEQANIEQDYTELVLGFVQPGGHHD